MVLVSIIMGLGITTLLDGTVNALRADTLTKPGLIHGFWVLFLLLFHIATWLLRWRAADRPQWTGPEVVAFLFAPIVLFALASLVFPRETREVDLNTYFIENRIRSSNRSVEGKDIWLFGYAIQQEPAT